MKVIRNISNMSLVVHTGQFTGRLTKFVKSKYFQYFYIGC